MTISEKQTVPDKAKQVVSDAEDDAPLASTHTPNRPEEESPGLFEDFLARSQLAPTLPFQRPKLPRTRSKSGDSPFTLKDRLLPASPPPAPRRSSFQTFAIKPVLSSSPDGGISSSLPKPNMMTTMNMASRLAGSRVKDQTIHHSLSDRSSTHAKPTPAQDSKSRSGGFSADGMKRISNGFGKEWSENKIAPCAWEPLAVPIMRLDEPKDGWTKVQAFFRESLSGKLDVHVRDVRVREPDEDFKHEYELIRTAAEKAGTSDMNEATIAHCDSLAQAAAAAKADGNLLALVRIWSEVDDEMEGWIRSGIATLAEEWKDRQLNPEKYEKLNMERKAALKNQMVAEKKAEDARKKLELKEVKRKMQEEREREKLEGKGKSGYPMGQDGFWPLEEKPVISDSESSSASSSDSDEEEGGLSSMEKKKRKKDAKRAAKKAALVEAGIVESDDQVEATGDAAGEPAAAGGQQAVVVTVTEDLGAMKI